MRRGQAVGGFEQFFLKLHVAEGLAVFVALGRKVVVVFHGCFLHGCEVGLGGGAADDECNVIGRACSRAECLHLFDEERHESLLVEDSLGLLVEIGLVG